MIPSFSTRQACEVKDYSQHGEQAFIVQHFKNQNPGTFLDIGANDGMTFSNSRALFKFGWHGVLVEPCYTSYIKLLRLYQDTEAVQLVNAAIGLETKIADFYESGELLGAGDHSLVSTCKPEEMDRWRKAEKPEHKIVEFAKSQVQMIDWAKFIAISRYKQFDFITIDVEGMELEILSQMDITALGCRLICVEYNGKNQAAFDSAIELPLLYKNRTNLIYGRD